MKGKKMIYLIEMNIRKKTNELINQNILKKMNRKRN